MRKAWLAGMGACALTLAAGQGLAGAMAAADGDLYVINASGRPMSVIVDQAAPADLPRLATARHSLTSGGHGVAVIQDGHVTSAWQAFDATNVSLNVKGRPAWCYLAERGGSGVRLQFLAPTDCRQMISAGPVEDVAGADVSRRP